MPRVVTLQQKLREAERARDEARAERDRALASLDEGLEGLSPESPWLCTTCGFHITVCDTIHDSHGLPSPGEKAAPAPVVDQRLARTRLIEAVVHWKISMESGTSWRHNAAHKALFDAVEVYLKEVAKFPR